MRLENPPFQRGETFYQGATVPTPDASDMASQLEGTEWEFPDLDYSVAGPTKPRRSPAMVRCRVVRNLNAAALLPKRLVSFQGTAGAAAFGRVDGYTTTTAALAAGVLDEYLPSAGVPANDLCYAVVKGPALCLTPLSNQSADVAVNGVLVAITGATSGSTTSGRVANQDLTGATALLANQVQSAVGRAMSSKLTNDTNNSILVYMGMYP
jgi:hypothetical protein